MDTTTVIFTVVAVIAGLLLVFEAFWGGKSIPEPEEDYSFLNELPKDFDEPSPEPVAHAYCSGKESRRKASPSLM
jgi:hypothetical protein